MVDDLILAVQLKEKFMSFFNVSLRWPSNPIQQRLSSKCQAESIKSLFDRKIEDFRKITWLTAHVILTCFKEDSAQKVSISANHHWPTCTCKQSLNAFENKTAFLHLSHDMTKPTKWVCAQQRLGSAWASAQSDQSSLCAQWVAKDPSFLHADSEDSDQTGWMPRLIWVFAGCTATLLVVSFHGSFTVWP